jgi:glucose-1-phosphate adenylyltransferase
MYRQNRYRPAQNGLASQTLALVLAGGRGERLQSLTDRQAKPAIPFGGKFRMIDFPLSNCINSGIRRIAVATQYRAHVLIHHINRAWSFLRPEMSEFVELWPAQQQTASAGWYAGTADAVHQNLELIRQHQPRYVLILSGDHVYKQDYRALLADHMEHDADVTISCVEVPRADGRRFGIMNVDDDDMITGFLEKPSNPPGLPDDPSKALASMGIYLFNTDVLISALKDDAKKADSSHDFGRDIIPALLKDKRLLAHRFSKSCVGVPEKGQPYWRDVGTLDAYWEANMDLVKSKPPFELYDDGWTIWTHQDNQAPARFLASSDERCGLVMNSVIGPGSVINGATLRNSILFENTLAESGSRVSEAVILPGCTIGPKARLSRCIIAENCSIPAGLVIGEDPTLDEQRFHRTVGGVTLVTSRMLQRLSASPAASVKRTVKEAPVRLEAIHSVA